MFKILRIICCVLAAALLAACIFIFVYLGTLWGVISLLGTAAFAGLMFLFKKLQEDEEAKTNPPPRKGDFITGPADDEDNNS